ARADRERLHAFDGAALVAVQVTREDGCAGLTQQRQDGIAGLQWTVAGDEPDGWALDLQLPARELDGSCLVRLVAEDDDLDRPVIDREAATVAGKFECLADGPGAGEELVVVA